MRKESATIVKLSQTSPQQWKVLMEYSYVQSDSLNI